MSPTLALLANLAWAVLAVGFCGSFAVIAWIAACECSDRAARRRHRCGECDTLDTSTQWLAYRCTVCGRLVELGAAGAGTNRKVA